MRGRLAAAAIAIALAVPAKAADEYPTRPVRVIVPFEPGGINETGARIVTTQLSERLGKQFIIEFKSGAGGMVGTEYATHLPADGYNIAVISVANAVHPALYNLTYDLRKAFEPVALLLTSPNTLAVHPSFPANTVSEFIALAKSKPGDIQYASAGVGGSLHLGMELFRMQAGIELLHIPFRGAGPAAIDVVAGNTKAVMSSTSTLSPHIRNGKLKGIAVSAKARLPSEPNVQTFIEAGFPQYEATNWIGFVVPTGTPKFIVEKLQKEVSEVLELPDVQKQLENRGAIAEKLTGAEFGAFIDSEIAKWGKVVKDANVKPE
ncbi:Bug family tripartite tricarboxylate transporter substrate binding protein [Rhodoplanes sp. Z2-YC6860]|uniref:Bug family tripartite tricarboxylate transporter substrate binding protein n=1 Tax=Rhodoplanes sp. Z2-YC6860 TaxID=674703 RepID=UPI00078D9E76|nr:tripartite tricarboxylate transporter substrate binding protein [Rhodoplanes sp. Z2-YC6860]AMN44922.1 TTT family tricarboxylate transporter, receptor protein [Rhodoplanes sp. Z2-YC6860]